MQSYIVLLRGINVGGHNKIKMAELRELLAKNNFTDLNTYIQSGNILLKSVLESETKVADKIKKIILDYYGYDISVLALFKNHFQKIFENLPWKERVDEEIKFLHVTICRGKLQTEKFPEIEKRKNGQEELLLIEDAIYLYCPDGFSKTKITNKDIEKSLNVKATTRNWNTMTKLHALLSAY